MDHDTEYHLQRAQRERALAERTSSAPAQTAHRQLAELHEARLICGDARTLRMIGRTN